MDWMWDVRKNKSSITPRLFPKATERKDLAFKERRDYKRAGFGGKSQEFDFRNFKFEILTACFEEEVFHSGMNTGGDDPELRTKI